MVRFLVRRLEPSPEAVECVGGLLATLAGDSHYMREIAEGYNDTVIHLVPPYAERGGAGDAGAHPSASNKG